MRRRDFLSLPGLAATQAAGSPADKPLRGIFPIAQTPFTEAGRLDLEALAAEVRFVDRCGAHGFVWPQLASEYATLSDRERMDGTAMILHAGKGLRPALVIGVQAADAAAAIRHARHAAQHGADAVIALPPPGERSAGALLTYYKAIGAATPLPLFAQAVGDLSVEELVEMSRAIPTLRYVKDEAGASPLPRIGPLRTQSGGALNVFTGGHGVTLLDEMSRGTAGSMPAASFVDLYAAAWEQWHSGRHAEAADRFSKAMLFVPEVQAYGIAALKYVLQLRGVFPTYYVRAKDGKAELDESGKKTLREMLEFVKPWLKT